MTFTFLLNHINQNKRELFHNRFYDTDKNQTLNKRYQQTIEIFGMSPFSSFESFYSILSSNLDLKTN